MRKREVILFRNDYLWDATMQGLFKADANLDIFNHIYNFPLAGASMRMIQESLKKGFLVTVSRSGLGVGYLLPLPIFAKFVMVI